MPESNPGTLAEKDVLALVAYILHLNGLPAGSKEIESPSDLNNVTLARPKQ
jgi:hypothetical protein